MATLDFTKMRSNKHVTVWQGLTGDASGIQDVAEPTAAEINNSGGASGMLNASPSISWNDFDFGIQDAETSNDPSLADEANFEDIGAAQWGGSISYYYPKDYDDNSNNHSLLYDLTDIPLTNIDTVVRIDGHKNNTLTPAGDGDFVSVFRSWTNSETNVTDASEAQRRTVGFLSAGEAAFYTIVGDHSITAKPPTGTPWAEGTKARIRGIVQDRDYTNALSFHSSDADVVRVYPGGFYEVVGDAADTATITITDEGTGDTTSVSVTVTS